MNIQWPLVLFSAIAGAGAWLFVCTAINEFRGGSEKLRIPTSITAIVLLLIGGVASATHLSHVERMLEVLNHPTEGIFLEALLLGCTAGCIFVYAVLVYRDASKTARKVFCVLAIGFGVFFSFACGKSYMMPSRPAWNTWTLPSSYMGTSAATGTALYLLFCGIFKLGEADVKRAGTYTVGGALIGLVCVLAFGVGGGVATGEQALLYWTCAVAIGCVVPGLCGLAATRKPELALTLGIIGSLGGFIGSCGIRSVMWLAGTVIADYFEVEI